jgi:hypothetical protein
LAELGAMEAADEYYIGVNQASAVSRQTPRPENRCEA